MNRIWERLGGWARRAAAAALTAGGRPVPRHIAFISELWLGNCMLGSMSMPTACPDWQTSRESIPCPATVAVDGNRRYAEARALRKVEGHAFGYARLLDALEWCLQVGRHERAVGVQKVFLCLFSRWCAHMARPCSVGRRSCMNACRLVVTHPCSWAWRACRCMPSPSTTTGGLERRWPR